MHKLKDNIVWLGLVITLILLVFVEYQNNDENTVVPVFAPSSVHKKTTSYPELEEVKHEQLTLRQQILEEPKNLFQVQKMVKQVHKKVEKKHRKVTPVNPYTYVGKLIEDGEIRVFMTNGNDNYVVKVGDTLDDIWKVTSIKKSEMVLLNLPSLTHVTVQIGVAL